MDDFLAWSGWGATIIATIIAVFQFFKKEDYKKQVLKLKVEIDKIENNTAYAKDKGVAVGKNTGDINIH